MSKSTYLGGPPNADNDPHTQSNTKAIVTKHAKLDWDVKFEDGILIGSVEHEMEALEGDAGEVM